MTTEDQIPNGENQIPGAGEQQEQNQNVNQTVDNTPGTGVDTNGDGVANTITGSEGEQNNVNDQGGNINESPDLTGEDQVKAPGEGIDTNGDGNADKIIGADGVTEVDVHEDSPDDYVNKVKLSSGPSNVMAKQTATKLVNDSNITENHKANMRQQISDGQLLPPYDQTMQTLKQASDNGTIYRPGVDGI